jgi:hypothetical protein
VPVLRQEQRARLDSGGSHNKVVIGAQTFCRAGESEKHVFTAFITGREKFSLLHHHVMRHPVLVMEDAIKPGLRHLLPGMEGISPQHLSLPSAPDLLVRSFNALDGPQISHSWPDKWHFSSDFRIIDLSQKTV